MSGVDVKLSQESLFFPLPFTNATIENVVQIKNTLASDIANKKANVVAFKVLSAVRHRYSVRPAVGFIAPGEAVTINFTLDPESIRNNPDPECRTLPTEKTKDVIYIDFAIVCGAGEAAAADAKMSEAANGKYLKAWLALGGAAAGKAVNDNRDVMDEASKFWKARGAAKPAGVERSSLRKKLPCVFDARDAAPDSLVVCMKAEGEGGAGSQPRKRGTPPPPAAAATAAVAPAPPVSRPPPTHRNSTAPPDGPPPRFSSHSPSASVTPRASRGATRQTSDQPSPSANGDAPAPSAVAKPSSSPTPVAPSAPPSAGRQTLATGIKRPFSLQQAAMKFSGGEAAEKRKALWKNVMNYKIPYAAAAVLVVLALLCGMFETDTVLSRMIAGY